VTLLGLFRALTVIRHPPQWFGAREVVPPLFPRRYAPAVKATIALLGWFQFVDSESKMRIFASCQVFKIWLSPNLNDMGIAESEKRGSYGGKRWEPLDYGIFREASRCTTCSNVTKGNVDVSARGCLRLFVISTSELCIVAVSLGDRSVVIARERSPFMKGGQFWPACERMRKIPATVAWETCCYGTSDLSALLRAKMVIGYGAVVFNFASCVHIVKLSEKLLKMYSKATHLVNWFWRTNDKCKLAFCLPKNYFKLVASVANLFLPASTKRNFRLIT